MPWANGHFQVNHPRCVWDEACPSNVLVHTTLQSLKGEDLGVSRAALEAQACYRAAKNRFNMKAAFDVVERLAVGPSYDALVLLAGDTDAGRPIKIAFPHPAFEKGHEEGQIEAGLSNALPFAYARYLADRLDGEVDENITQIARIGRTEMGRWERFLYQPAFRGDVDPSSYYILVDDVLTFGATFAALRSHIVSNGGAVLAVAALAHRDGINQPFPIFHGRIRELADLFGSGIFRLWQETIGHEIHALTELEGAFLCERGHYYESDGWQRGVSLLQRIRARLDRAASQGRQ